jgi:hypothetical protein
MADAFTDLFSKWLSPPYIYIIFAVIAIVAIIIFLKRRKGKEIEHFKGDSLEDIFKKKNFNKYMDLFGRKCKKGILYWNMGSTRVNKLVFLKTLIEPVRKGDLKKDREHRFLIFQKSSFWSFLPFLGNKMDNEIFAIDDDREFINKDSHRDRWVINQNVNLSLLGGVWISSLNGQSLLSELIYKNTYENDKETETNTPKRFVWYNDIYAHKLTSTTLSAELEKDKYDSAVKRETGTK